MKSMRTILILLLALTFSACAGIRPAPPEVQLAGLEITDVSLSHANFLATLKLFNPNSVSMDIKGLQFTLFLNDTRVAKGLTAKSFSIPAEDYGEAAIRLSSSFLDLFQLTRSLQGQEAISFRITGEVKVGGMGLISSSIPIEREGTLPLTGTLNQLRSKTLQPSPMDSIGEQIISK